jgi:hypothetical protein
VLRNLLRIFMQELRLQLQGIHLFIKSGLARYLHIKPFTQKFLFPTTHTSNFVAPPQFSANNKRIDKLLF